MSTTRDYPQLLEIDAGDHVLAVTFTASSEYIVCSGNKGVQVWRAKDGIHVATMPTKAAVFCVAASKDGRWIAGGEWGGNVLVWDATTYGQVFAEGRNKYVWDVDFSPDSTRLAAADGTTATIWDVAASQQVQTLDRTSDRSIVAVKYSPQGDRIATSTYTSVQVWDSDNGRLLFDTKVRAKGWRGLVWRDNHLFVRTQDSTIKEINAATGSTVLEWAAPGSENYACITLPQHGKALACMVNKTIYFWDTTTRTQLNPIQHSHDVYSVACSSDGRLFSIAASKQIVLKDLSSISPSVSEPDLEISADALNAWKDDRLADAEALLSAPISASASRHHVFASRALVRARLERWDEALVDAEESVEIQRSVIGYIANIVALAGKGETHKACGLCDVASLRFPSDHVFLLLVKAVVLFKAGKHHNAISRISDLITDGRADPALYVVQAYMHLLLGNSHMESNNHDRAIWSFEDAQMKLSNCTRVPPLVILLIFGWRFDDLAVTIRQRLCEAHLAADRVKEAGELVFCMVDQQINMTESIKTWVSNFKFRCRSKLEDLGDSAANARKYDEAVSHYTAALSLDPASPQDLLAKRSKAYAEDGKWDDALNDANEIIDLDLPSPLGYERKHAALCGMRNYNDAVDAFETMLSKVSGSSDPAIREQSRHYVRPEQTKEAIRASIKKTIRDSPLVLIDASSGRLCNKLEQATAFESTPAFTRLVASMTTRIDYTFIERLVGEFYRYVMLSHVREKNEHAYEEVIGIVVYDLEASPAHKKLQTFCKIVRDEGFSWAWSDTCCVDNGNIFVLQEAFATMFKWYEGSAMTIVFLGDVDGLAQLGALTTSIWNSCPWALQGYHASKVVRIYTRDWTPYLGLTIHNHKESPEVISEMERVTGISAQSLMTLQPGLGNIREKLRLASTRLTTRVEDGAYSLLGFFSISLPVAYGEGDKALGRLLSQLLMNSGDTSILAWSGKSGGFNSCLPASLTVFSQPPTSHIPPVIPDGEMGIIAAGLRASSLDLDLVTRLYNRVNGLRNPIFAEQWMRLPCLAFKIRLVSGCRDGSELLFRAQSGVLGGVEIRTRQNLTRLDSLYLIHPWIDFLLDRHVTRKIVEVAPDEEATSDIDDSLSFDSFSDASTSYADPLDSASLPPSPMLSTDVQTHVYEFLARLRQPFGALLLTSTRQNVEEYKRIATESLITAQVKELTSATLDRLIQDVRVLDIV